ncbi:hypothetical protein B0T10DRAFT_455212 [Thelonectria olida]|uniref:Zn(2)-C6 fungal-type domain-containing protein n=1 Tax=Thelonectria olida TaxID=1576542 RepID=A0A9P8WFI5_9HYPO|nr:hypothetical protein B0T10DRAFT_455212 [Thelonectria olida]
MAETVIRKACDRCHAQKLSCKRDKDESCERCVRLKTECKSSPSLRYKKHNHQQQQQQQQQQQLLSHGQRQLESEPAAPSGHRSPKRRRTDSDPSLVPPDAGTCHVSKACVDHRLTLLAEAVPIVPHTGGLTSKSHLAVTPDPVLELGDFNFNFDPLGLFAANQGEYLSHPGVPGCVDRVHHPLSLPPQPQQQPPSAAFTDSWDPRVASSDAYPSVALDPLLPPGDAPSQAVVIQGPLGGGCVAEHGSSDKRDRQRTRRRPRQIHLTDHDHAAAAESSTAPLVRDSPLIHWMAQLTDINARLLDLSSVLPASQETTRNGPSLMGRPADERFKASGFPIDDMFQLTRRVADILEQPAGPEAGPETMDSSDPSNAMFVLSTYMRLLDMYQKVFGLVHAEVRQTSSAQTQFRFWKLPDVTVGSFAVQSSPFLQMSLTIQLAEEFLSRLRRSTGRWSLLSSSSSSRAGGGAASMFAGVAKLSFQAFKEREEELAKHLVDLRSEIEALLDA